METITSTETSRDRFYAYRTDVAGPFIVEVATYSHVSDTRPVINDSFRVYVNGESRWGGFASHLDVNGPESLGGFHRIEDDTDYGDHGYDRVGLYPTHTDTMLTTHIKPRWTVGGYNSMTVTPCPVCDDGDRCSVFGRTP